MEAPEDEKAALKVKIASLEAEKAELKGKIAELEAKIAELVALPLDHPERGRLTGLEGQLAGLRGVRAALQQRLAIFEERELLLAQQEAAGESSDRRQSSSQELVASVLNGVRELLQNLGLSEATTLSITPSKASMKAMKEAAQRLQYPVIEGLFFHAQQQQQQQRQGAQLTQFIWPLNAAREENEVAGYKDAVQWLQAHVCPPGIQAVQVDRLKWLQCHDESKHLHIREGNTDVVFVLEDYAPKLREPGASVTSVFSAIAGQVELKTTSKFQAQAAAVKAQAGIEHLSACYLLDQVVKATHTKGHAFVTVATDLSKRWLLYRMTALEDQRAMEILENPPRPDCSDVELLECAASQTKELLSVSAQQLRDNLVTLTQAPPPSAGEEEPPDTRPAGEPFGEPSSRGSAGLQRGGGGGSAGSAPGACGCSSLEQGRFAQLQVIAAQALADDDACRTAGAAYSAALVSFLRHPLGYKGLLGLDSPPTSICHPHLSELAEYPFSEHPRLVRDSVLSNMG